MSGTLGTALLLLLLCGRPHIGRLVEDPAVPNIRSHQFVIDPEDEEVKKTLANLQVSYRRLQASEPERVVKRSRRSRCDHLSTPAEIIARFNGFKTLIYLFTFDKTSGVYFLRDHWNDHVQGAQAG